MEYVLTVRGVEFINDSKATNVNSTWYALESMDKPTILITSGEHYGAVLNLDFDYARYLDELHAHGLNLTRTFAGTYLPAFYLAGAACLVASLLVLAARPGRSQPINPAPLGNAAT